MSGFTFGFGALVPKFKISIYMQVRNCLNQAASFQTIWNLYLRIWDKFDGLVSEAMLTSIVVDIFSP
jgi:hypothetical protein